MAAHSTATHASHSSTHVTPHPEHAWTAEKCLEYLIRIHFACNEKRMKSEKISGAI
jgi:hypothetical protein